MAITSFAGPRKRIGPRGWKVLHTSGMYLLWGIFVVSYLGRAPSHPLYAAFLGLMLLALVVRIGARIARRLRADQS
jgi:sulfoxide reductase heme-binding subunit YedZ